MKAWLGSVVVVLAAGLAVVAGVRPEKPTPPPSTPAPLPAVVAAADPTAPPAPKAEPAKVPAPVRPRITQRAEVGYHATLAGWSADGRRVALLGAGKVKLFEGDRVDGLLTFTKLFNAAQGFTIKHGKDSVVFAPSAEAAPGR